MFHSSQNLIGIQVMLTPTKIILLWHKAQIHFTVELGAVLPIILMLQYEKQMNAQIFAPAADF